MINGVCNWYTQSSYVSKVACACSVQKRSFDSMRYERLKKTVSVSKKKCRRYEMIFRPEKRKDGRSDGGHSGVKSDRFVTFFKQIHLLL